jgi:hypothetical protein
LVVTILQPTRTRSEEQTVGSQEAESPERSGIFGLRMPRRSRSSRRKDRGGDDHYRESALSIPIAFIQSGLRCSAHTRSTSGLAGSREGLLFGMRSPHLGQPFKSIMPVSRIKTHALRVRIAHLRVDIGGHKSSVCGAGIAKRKPWCRSKDDPARTNYSSGFRISAGSRSSSDSASSSS